MKKRIVRVALSLGLIILVILLILLTSCRGRVAGGEMPQDTATLINLVKTGTQGVELRLLNNYPPPIIYDKNELVILLEVQNKGNYNLPAEDCFVQITGFDPNIIGGNLQEPRSCAENLGGILDGKNVYNIEGGTNQLEFKSMVNLPSDIFDYAPPLNFLTCYHYHTKASPQICVDPLFYQVTAEQKTCIPHDVGLGGGQGGPVGIGYVGVDMAGGKAILEMNVVNYGNGQVVRPANIYNCGKGSIGYQDLDKVQFNVELSGGSLISCKPDDHLVRLVNKQGKIVCQFNINGASAFETPLMVDLDYGYVQSQLRTVKIVKTPE